MKVVGFAAQMQNGKNIAADYLQSRLENWHQSSFASNVKRIFCETFGVDLEFVEKWKTNPDPPPGFKQSVRKSLQFIGDGFRTIQDDIWIDLAFRNETRNVLVTDCRYINELRKIKEVGGIVILLYRPGFENNDPNGSEAQIRPVVDFYKQSLEGVTKKLSDYTNAPNGAELVDIFLKNDGTKEDLYRKIDEIIIPLMQEKNYV